jgi:hypothetical protein
MLRLMLNSHPALCVPFESGFIVEFFRRSNHYGDLAQRNNARRLLSDIGSHPLARKGNLVGDIDTILDLSLGRYADVVDAIFTVYANARGKKRWGDKTPSYVTDIDVLRALFPACKILHLVRDGRDVALSNQNVEWGLRRTPRIAADWRWKTLLAHKVGAVLGEDYMLIHYENLVVHTERTLRKIADFLEEPYSDQMLAYHRTGLAEMPPQSLAWHRNSIRAPDANLVNVWKHAMPVADRIIFEQCAGDALETFGYPLERRHSTLGSRLKNFYFATIARY